MPCLNWQYPPESWSTTHAVDARDSSLDHPYVCSENLLTRSGTALPNDCLDRGGIVHFGCRFESLEDAIFVS